MERSLPPRSASRRPSVTTTAVPPAASTTSANTIDAWFAAAVAPPTMKAPPTNRPHASTTSATFINDVGWRSTNGALRSAHRDSSHSRKALGRSSGRTFTSAGNGHTSADVGSKSAHSASRRFAAAGFFIANSLAAVDAIWPAMKGPMLSSFETRSSSPFVATASDTAL